MSEDEVGPASTPRPDAPPGRPSLRPSRRPSIGPAAPRPTPFSQLKHDAPASIVVFLVALPLCLGIAHASGAPLLSGVLAGIIGGLVVSWVSGAQLAVTGPAAGLTTVVLAGVAQLGSFEAFCLATMLAGAIQIVFGLIQAGIIAYYFPTSVIKGMLAAIGIVLILKQLPHALGIDTDFMGDEALSQEDGRNTFTEVFYALSNARIGALIVAAVGLVTLIAMDHVKALAPVKARIPAPLVCVLLGIGLNAAFAAFAPELVIDAEDRVALPTGGPGELLGSLHLPAFSRILEPAIWTTALTIAAVASIETLLCVEAIDKLDPYKRVTPANRELIAQGVGNAVAGLVGALPMTAVIVRGSANVQAGARTKLSAALHGLWFVLALFVLPWALNLIPLASLAAVLLYVGYNLTRATLWRQMWNLGPDHFLPFAVTVVAVNVSDLLTGVAIGLGVGMFVILRDNFRTPYFVHHRESAGEGGAAHVHIQLSEHVSFLNKAAVRRLLQEIPRGATVEIDGTRSRFIDRDVLEIIHDFSIEAKLKDIELISTALPPFQPTGPGH